MGEMSKSCIYYTDNNIDEKILSMCQKHIEESGLPITSCSLKPIDFGDNYVLNEERSYPTMVKQILKVLVMSQSKYVFFCEHDVKYHITHFDFTPPRDDVFYYNTNNWRWDYPKDRVIHYDNLISLSMLCCNRELALNYYRNRLNTIESNGLDKIKSREPQWVRRMGYEPGTKGKHKYFETWQSEYPNIDIRHSKTFSPPKVKLDKFKKAPVNWQERTLDKIEGWNLWTLA